MMDMNKTTALNASDNSTIHTEGISEAKKLVPIVFGIIFTVGAIGNGTLMFIICRYKSMRNLPNIFVFNLALGDLFVLFIALPFTSLIFTSDSWPFGEFLCKASEFAKDISTSVSVFTLTALSFDRYKVVVQPVESYVAGPKSKQRIIFSLVVIWVASLALAIPTAIFSHLITASEQPNSSTVVFLDDFDINQPEWNETQDETPVFISQFCYPFPGKFGPGVYSQSIVLGRFFIQYLIPLLIIGTLYTITARSLMHSVENIEGQATTTTVSSIPNRRQHPSTIPTFNNPNRNQECRRKVAVMVQSLFVLFFICFLPKHIFLLWFHFNPNSQMSYNHFWHSLKIVGFVFSYTNSCINPIALYYISTNFRKYFDRLLFCCCRNLSDNQAMRPCLQNRRRKNDNNPLNEFQQHGLNLLASSEQTASDKRTTSNQIDSNVPQIVVFTVRDDNSQITHRNPSSFIPLTIE